MAAYRADLQDIVARLNVAQRRVRTRLFLAATVWASAAALITYAGLIALQRLMPGLQRVVFDPAGLALLAAALVLALLLPVAAYRTPSLMRLARKADAIFGLKERISTAFELRAGAVESLAEAALVRDAANCAGAIDPKALAPVSLPRATWMLPALCLAVLAVFVFPIAPEPVPQAGLHPDDGVAPMVAAFTEPEREDAAAAIARISDMVEVAAAKQASPELEELARMFDALSRQVLADVEFGQNDIFDRLDELVRAGAAEWDAETGARISEMMETGKLQTDPARTLTAAAGSSALTGQPEQFSSADTIPGETGPVEQNGQQADEPGQTLGAPGSPDPSNRPSSDGGAAPDGQGTPSQAASDYFGMVERDAQNNAQPTDMMGNFAQGESDDFTAPTTNPWGGDSTRATIEEAMAVGDLAGAFDTDAELMLEAAGVDAGESVLKDRPPVAHFTPMDDRPSAMGDPAWVASDERELARGWLRPDLRDVVSAYFMAIGAEASK